MSELDLNQIEKDLDQAEEVSNDYLKGAFVRFGLRWTIIIFLYLILWSLLPWVCWILLLLVPLGAYSLYRLVTTQDRLDSQFKEIREALEEARKFGPEEE